LSDKNLSSDRFFTNEIRKNKEGWLNLKLIMNCNNIKKITGSIDDVINALEQSNTIKLSDDKTSIKRKKPISSL